MFIAKHVRLNWRCYDLEISDQAITSLVKTNSKENISNKVITNNYHSFINQTFTPFIYSQENFPATSNLNAIRSNIELMRIGHFVFRSKLFAVESSRGDTITLVIGARARDGLFIISYTNNC